MKKSDWYLAMASIFLMLSAVIFVPIAVKVSAVQPAHAMANSQAIGSDVFVDFNSVFFIATKNTDTQTPFSIASIENKSSQFNVSNNRVEVLVADIRVVILGQIYCTNSPSKIQISAAVRDGSDHAMVPPVTAQPLVIPVVAGAANVPFVIPFARSFVASDFALGNPTIFLYIRQYGSADAGCFLHLDFQAK